MHYRGFSDAVVDYFGKVSVKTGQARCNECADVILLQPRQTVLTAAGSIGQASGDLLRHMGEGETDEKFQVGRSPLTISMSVSAKQEVPHRPIPSGLP